METQPAFLRSGLSCHLFIYLVQEEGEADTDTCRYCTVLAYGRTLEAAEGVAISRVHQQGLHILRTDTATPAPWLDPVRDGEYLAELARSGCALSVSDNGARGAARSASAA